MSDKIYIRRGNKANLPALAAGEPGVALDAKQVFVGTDGTLAGNVGLASALSGGDKIQTGIANATVSTGGAAVTVNVTFPIPFATPPRVYPTLNTFTSGAGDAGYNNVTPGSITNTGFLLRVNSYVAQSFSVNWFAIGT